MPSLFLGGVTYISSSGVIAKLLSDLGWTENRETPVALSILVFEDLAMAVLLPVLGVVALGGSTSAAVLSIGIALGVIAGALTFARRCGSRGLACPRSRLRTPHGDRRAARRQAWRYEEAQLRAGMTVACSGTKGLGYILTLVGMNRSGVQRAHKGHRPVGAIFRLSYRGTQRPRTP